VLIRSFVTRLALALAITPLLTATLHAQDPFELEVYTPATAAPGEWELGINANYVASGSTSFDGPLAPTDRQGRLSVELDHGLTRNWEVAVYGLAATRPGAGADLVGWRLKTRVRAPDSWRLPIQLGLNVEVEQTDLSYGEHRKALEIAPILAWSRGPLTLALDLPFERGLGGTEEQEFEAEPRARVALGVSRSVTLTTEYFNAPEDAGGTGAKQVRRQLLIPGLELHLGDDFTWNFGVGFGLSETTDDLVLRTGVEFPLHE
jgi:hypothetical protein